MKKIFLNEAEKQKIIANKEKAIMESFAKAYNKIKRIDENDISGQPNWEEMWEDSPKDIKTLMYFSKNMPKDLWKNFLETHRTDIEIAQAEFKSLKKKYGSSSMFENDGLDMGELGRQERSAQYGIDPYQEQPDLTPQEGDTYTNVNVLTQDGTYEKRNVTVVSVYPENREALVRTDAGGDVIVSFDDLNGLNDTPTGMNGFNTETNNENYSMESGNFNSDLEMSYYDIIKKIESKIEELRSDFNQNEDKIYKLETLIKETQRLSNYLSEIK